MGNIPRHSDFKKSVVKAMPKRRKHVYCWKVGGKNKQNNNKNSNDREKTELLRFCFVVIFSIMKLYVEKMSKEI